MLDYYQYTCGSSLQDLKTTNDETPVLNALLDQVYVRANLNCSMPVEVPYFTCESFMDVCFYCGLSGEDCELTTNNTDMYPHCATCLVKNGAPLRRKQNLFAQERARIAAKKQK